MKPQYLIAIFLFYFIPTYAQSNFSGIGGSQNYNITGAGTTNWISKFKNDSTLQNSSIFDNGNIGIGTTNPLSKLSLTGGFALGSYAGVYSAPINGMIVSGNVGIGTQSPTEKLDVLGRALIRYNYNTSGDGVLKIAYNSQTPVAILGYEGGGAPGSGLLSLHTGYDNLERIKFSAASNSFINNGYNLGIGTANPISNMHIANSNGPVLILERSATNPVQDALLGELVARGTGNGISQNSVRIDFNADGNWTENHPSRISFWTTNASGGTYEAMRINKSGYVGIGTLNPPERLSVNGKIRAKEIIVNTNWSDFVFGSQYNLKGLNEVESYIKENKHLPDIPTAEEVQKNGISVGEMQSKLLQKIEELTLYVIEQNKQIEELKIDNSKLKKYLINNE